MWTRLAALVAMLQNTCRNPVELQSTCEAPVEVPNLCHIKSACQSPCRKKSLNKKYLSKYLSETKYQHRVLAKVPVTKKNQCRALAGTCRKKKVPTQGTCKVPVALKKKRQSTLGTTQSTCWTTHVRKVPVGKYQRRVPGYLKSEMI